MTADQIRAFADRCAERDKEGLMIGPASVATVVEALRLLAEDRAKGEPKRARKA
jgi:hypothetical protein